MNYLDKAFMIKARKKREAESLASSIKERLRKDRLYLSLEESRDTLLFERARLVSQNGDLGTLNQQIEELSFKLELRLKELGVDKESLVPCYECKLCNDSGMVLGQNCSCIKMLVTKLLQEDAGELMTDKKDFKKVFASLKQDGDHLLAYRSLYSYLHDYTKAFPNVSHKIVGVLGGTGTGKSYAVSVAANILVENGFSVYMLNAQKLNDIFLRYHLASIEQKTNIFSALTMPELLIIDDLGAEPIFNNVTIECLYTLLSKRSNKQTMFTTNLSMPALEDRYGQRIFSRLADRSFTIHFLLEGRDLRL